MTSDAFMAEASDWDRPIEVVGEGPRAREVRRALALADAPGQDRPRTVVETTGTDAGLRDALDRVADLGTVLLAGPELGHVDLDLYPDLHLRGLTLRGVAS